jgi:flagellar hook assembly protein FlgD
VRLEIYDARGALVRTLVDGHVGAGRHERRWDGRDHAGRQVGSGVYLVRFASGGQRTSQKMVILK